MKLSAPTKGIFIVSVVLVVIGLLGYLGIIPQAAGYAYWLTVIGFGLLCLGNVAKGF